MNTGYGAAADGVRAGIGVRMILGDDLDIDREPVEDVHRYPEPDDAPNPHAQWDEIRGVWQVWDMNASRWVDLGNPLAPDVGQDLEGRRSSLDGRFSPPTGRPSPPRPNARPAPPAPAPPPPPTAASPPTHKASPAAAPTPPVPTVPAPDPAPNPSPLSENRPVLGPSGRTTRRVWDPKRQKWKDERP